MPGVNRVTGRALDGWSHVSQSIGDILSTPIGTRVERRDYGSALFELIDRPINASTVARAARAVAEAILRWEPRFEVTKVEIDEASAGGRLGLAVTGIYYPRGHLGDYTVYEPVQGERVRI
jgi:phage baseplate assembly protein W